MEQSCSRAVDIGQHVAVGGWTNGRMVDDVRVEHDEDRFYCYSRYHRLLIERDEDRFYCYSRY